ncbi:MULTISPECIES: chloride channel protein [unclassified Gordonia (in: high G+C Gram-positive bacteria)]
MWARRLAFGFSVVAIGVLAGLIGLATTFALHALQHLTFGYQTGSLLLGVSDAPWQRRLFGPVIGGVLAGACWWLLRRRRHVLRLEDEVREGDRLDVPGQTADALIQILAVGTGASLGREGAPRQLAAVAATRVTSLFAMTPDARRLLWAAAAGAGLAAVYNVPIAGALFTVEVLLRSWRPAAVLTALAVSAIAVGTTWPITHGAPTFAWPVTHTGWGTIIFACAVIPVAVLLGRGFLALTSGTNPLGHRSPWIIVAIGAAGLLTGVAALYLPELPGNGKSIVATTFSPTVTLAAVAAAVVLKPVLTAAYLRAGATGGLLTPAFATGAALGAFVALLIRHLGGHASVPGFALIAACAVLAVTQRTAFFATAFAAELVHPPLPMVPILLVAALGSYWLDRGIRARTVSADRTDGPPHRRVRARCRRRH